MSEKKEAVALNNRQTIVRASLDLFSRLGFEKVTMDDIARSCDYSKRTVYQYFNSKESVYYAAVLSSFQSLYETVLAVIDPVVSGKKNYVHQTVDGTTDENAQEIRKQLRASFFDVGAALFCLYAENPLAFDSMIRFSELPDAESPYATELNAVYETGEQINALLGRYLRTLMDAGLVKENLPEIPTIFMLWSSLTGIFPLARAKQAYLKLSAKMDAEIFVEYSFELLFRAIEKR